MTAFDFILLGTLGISGLLGLIRGLLKEVLSLVAYGLAFLCAIWWGPTVDQLLAGWLTHEYARMGAAYVGLFVLTLLTVGLFNVTLAALMRSTGLTPADHGLGGLFGLLRGCLLVLVMVVIAGYTPLPAEPWWKNAMFSKQIVGLVQQLKERLPPPVDQWLPY